jgi:hypothetical protein
VINAGHVVALANASVIAAALDWNKNLAICPREGSRALLHCAPKQHMVVRWHGCQEISGLWLVFHQQLIGSNDTLHLSLVSTPIRVVTLGK